MSAEDEAMLKAYTPDPEIGLFGGRWVPTGTGTVRWQQERQPTPPRKRPIVVAATCVACHQEYGRTSVRQKYCSDSCRFKARRDRGKDAA
jgi:hypothetical protein